MRKYHGLEYKLPNARVKLLYIPDKMPYVWTILTRRLVDRKTREIYRHNVSFTEDALNCIEIMHHRLIRAVLLSDAQMQTQDTAE